MQWNVPITPATLEAEEGRLPIQGQSGQFINTVPQNKK